MEPKEQTIQQINRAIRKIADKFPETDEPTILTDVHLRVSQETGEMLVLDDDDREITRCVIDEWIENKADNFYDGIASVLRTEFDKNSKLLDSMSILKPYAFVLESDDRDEQHEIHVCDGDTIIIDSNLMEGLEEDLDAFFKNIMKE